MGDIRDIGTIGFLADTHSSKPDGSDLPDAVLRAFTDARVDLIVHLGDIGRHGIIGRLEEVAPVLVPFGSNKGYVRKDSDDEPEKVIATRGGLAVGLWFNLAQPDKKITVADDGITFDGPMDALLTRRFKEKVDVVAFGGTHRTLEQRHGDVLFVNPGSPTLPADGVASVAVLDVSGSTAKVEFIAITR